MNAAPVLVTIAIPTYNRANRLKDAIESEKVLSKSVSMPESFKGDKSRRSKHCFHSPPTRAAAALKPGPANKSI